MTSSVDEEFRNALAALQARRVTEAERLFKRLLSAEPKHVPGLNLLCALLMTLGRFEEAESYAQRALNENTTSDVTFYNYGLILKALKRPKEALERFNQALVINPTVAESWNNRGTVFNDLRRYREAIADFDKAISINSKYADAYYNKGRALAEIRLFDQSLAALDQALLLRPELANAWVGRGNVFARLEQLDDALAAYEKAIALKSDLAEAWLGRGKVFAALKQYDNSLASYEKSIVLNADLAEAWVGRGNVFVELRQYDSAFAAYDKALALKPDLEYTEGLRLFAKLHLNDWVNLETEVSLLLSAVRDGKKASPPFPLLSIPSSPSDQLQCARCYIADQPSFAPIWSGDVYSHDRIRIAYLSADFRNHPIGHLIVGVLEQHDQSQFDVTAISFGPDDRSDLRRRIKSSNIKFLDVLDKSDQDIAKLVRRLEIDVVIDLMGFTTDARPNVLAWRAAPIQVNYLGYPGTMGADYIDYIISDLTIVPREHVPFYNEQVVWLPECYQANDRLRGISERTPTRGQCALPDDAFVFCCFNSGYKIMPDIFDIWMRLLLAKENSILWLIDEKSKGSENLRREALKRGVSADRLIFAPKIPLADHLARHRQADLFLDTLPYNAHTTASDALWAGLPVVTCLGSTFAGRVAGSLLKALGLDELVTSSLEDYEAEALKLSRDPALLASLKGKLAHHREGYPLFNTVRFTRHIEAAYKMMWDRQQKGAAPQGFAVGPID